MTSFSKHCGQATRPDVKLCGFSNSFRMVTLYEVYFLPLGVPVSLKILHRMPQSTINQGKVMQYHGESLVCLKRIGSFYVAIYSPERFRALYLGPQIYIEGCIMQLDFVLMEMQFPAYRRRKKSTFTSTQQYTHVRTTYTGCHFVFYRTHVPEISSMKPPLILIVLVFDLGAHRMS